MEFSQSESQKMIQNMVSDFAKKHIEPHVMEWDEAQFFPVDLFKKMGDQGLMGMLVPEEFGGSGLSYMEYVTAIIEISKVCGSIGLSMAAHNSLCTNHILEFGSEEIKKMYLPKLASGDWIGAWGLTEVNTGSDAMRMMCTAEDKGDHFVLNGTKNWITHGKSCKVAVILARTGDLLDSKGISAFVIEKDNPGFSHGKKENKLGMRASETTELIFDNCIVPKTHVLGEVGEGFYQAMKILDGGRISIAALSIGIGKGAYEAALKYANEREQFGKPISQFQAIAFKLADMYTELEVAELLTYKSADLKNRKQKVTTVSAMAKYQSSEAAVKLSTEAIQIFGGNGYTKNYPVEKFYRDSKLCTIGEGTSEIQKLVIARNILNE